MNERQAREVLEGIDAMTEAFDDPFRAIAKPVWTGMWENENNATLTVWAIMFPISSYVLCGDILLRHPFPSVLVFLVWMAVAFLPLWACRGRGGSAGRVREIVIGVSMLALVILTGADMFRKPIPGLLYVLLPLAFVSGRLWLPHLNLTVAVLLSLLWSGLSWAVAHNFTDWSAQADAAFWSVGILASLFLALALSSKGTSPRAPG